MKNAKKFDVKMLAIWLIVLAAFVAVVFLLPISRNAVFYVAFAMTLVSFGLVAFAYVQSFLHDNTLSSKLLGFPIFRVSLIALALQMLVFVTLGALSALCPIWLAVIIEGLVLAGTAVCLIATEAARGVVEEAEVKLTDRTQMIKRLRAQAETVVSLQTNEHIKTEVERLSQALRYSDPVSSDATKEVELEIEKLLGKLYNGVDADIEARIKRALVLVQQRNSIIKSNK